MFPTDAGTDLVDIADSNMGNNTAPMQLIMDKNGFPHIIYLAYVVSDPLMGPVVELRYAWLEVNNGVRKWNIQTILTPQVDYGMPTQIGFALALDSANLPHVAYMGYNLGAFYTNFDGTSWTNPHPLSVLTSYYNAQQIYIKIDSSDTLHIVYGDDPDGDGNTGMYYASKNNGTWADIKTIVSNGWPNSNLELDVHGTPYIAVIAQNPDYTQAYYMAKLKTDGSWGEFCSLDLNWENKIFNLTLDPNGYPNIVYGSSDNSVVRYGQWTGVEWLTSDIWQPPADSNTSLRYPIASYNQNGIPVVSFLSSVYNPATSESNEVFNSARLE